MAPVVTDTITAAILRELKANARLPLATLGRRVGLSRTAVKQRLERLERAGYILGYTTVGLDDGKRPPAVSAVLLVDRVDRLHGANVITRLKAVPEIGECHVLTGGLDLLVEVRGAGTERLRDIMETVAAIDGVRNAHLYLVLDQHAPRPTQPNREPLHP
jgi:DNA-binding Lrp family transcriptional regulator